jgi:pyrroline-5-carboxylate reductase
MRKQKVMQQGTKTAKHRPQSETRTLAVLGAGKMGGILLQAFAHYQGTPRLELSATVQHAERAGKLGERFNIAVTTDNRRTARNADVIFLCVKPQVADQVLAEIRPEVGPNKLVISIVASVPTSYIEDKLGKDVPVVRAMPNTPSVVGCGMTAICKGRYATDEHMEIAKKLFTSVGRCAVADENKMDAITGLSASGPAYIYIILESLAEAGVKVGLSRELATELAAQTVLGAAQMVLKTGEHPALLKEAVTTPAGCTIDGILELEEGKLRVTLIKAVVKATQRAKELLIAK